MHDFNTSHLLLTTAMIFKYRHLWFKKYSGLELIVITIRSRVHEFYTVALILCSSVLPTVTTAK